MHLLKQLCLTHTDLMQGMHVSVLFMTYVEGRSKVVVVGDNGAAQYADTSHHLADALSRSMWDLANSAAG